MPLQHEINPVTEKHNLDGIHVLSVMYDYLVFGRLYGIDDLASFGVSLIVAVLGSRAVCWERAEKRRGKMCLNA